MVAHVTAPEAARHHLYTRVSEELDQESADTLMQGLVYRDDLATRDDLALLRTELKGDIAILRTEVKGDIATLEATLRGEIHTTVAGAVSELNRSMRNWMGGVLIAVIGALIGSQFIG